MKLYVFQNDGEDNASVMREASPAELLEAVRPHADLEAAVLAAADVIERWFGPDDTDEGDAIEAEVVEAVLVAALGADDEG